MLDKDTHTWRWWPRRVVTRLLLQPADTGQEEAEEMGEKVEVEKEKKEEVMKEIRRGKKGSKLCSDDSGCVCLRFQAFAYSASLLPIEKETWTYCTLVKLKIRIIFAGIAKDF